jgi:membrane-bound lytic murein transglycosylase D
VGAIPNSPVFTAVDTGSQIDLAMAADMAGIPLDDLYRLNPGFNRWATAPDGPHYLLIPIERAEEFKTKLAQLDPNQRMQWRRYKIKSGDSLGIIAANSGTTVKLIKQINKIKGNNIRAGRHLLLPVASKQPSQYALSATERKSKIQNRERSGTRITHIVRAGDTMWDLAQRYNVHHRSLARWNGMAPRDTLSVGQKLVIWTKEQKQTSIQNLNIDARPPNSRSTVRYRVRQGDSLSRIAQRFRVSVADLRSWNSLPGKYLQPGQRLKLYVDVTEQTL